MTLPKKPLKEIKSSHGQILILFLLILVVGLAIVLSIASRTVTDIRTTTTSDESNRAYFAAEAGIEEALRQMDLGSSSDLTLDFTGLNQSEAKVAITPGGAEIIFVYPETVAKDDVVQVNFLDTWNDLSSNSWSGNLKIYWGAAAHDAGDPDASPAIEVAVIYKRSAGVNWVIPREGISKAAFDPFNGRGGFTCPITEALEQLSGPQGNVNFHFSATVNITGGTEDCANLDEDSGEPVLARIRVLYASSPIAVEVGATDDPLPAQGDLIASSGNTLSGVTRKLEVTRLYPAMSSLFDYVLFSGSTTKPLEK